MNNYIQPGDTITWTNGTGAAVKSGDVVVVGTRVLGIAAVDIANAGTGAVQLTGVFTVPKVAAAVFNAGDVLTWDSSAGAFDDAAATPASGDIVGSVIAAKAGANTEATCEVKFLGVPGTLTA